jgi:hypothetical protein
MLLTADSAQVQGFVVDGLSGEGLEALAVQLSLEGEVITVTTTDDAGGFQFDGLVAGTYALSSASTNGGGQVGFESAPLRLSIGEAVSDLVLDAVSSPALATN